MSRRLELAVCPAFLGEVRAALAALAQPDVDVVTVPTTCRVTLHTPETGPAPPQHTRLWLACSAAAGAHVPPGWETAAPEQCFHLVAPSPLVAAAQRDGAYVVTPGWVRNWRTRLTDWGFDQAGAREFFAESMKEIALLDTGVDPEVAARTADFADYVGLPLRVIPVGVELLQLRLAVLIHAWRARGEQAQAHEELVRVQHRESELAMALDLLRALAGATTVAHAVDGLAELARTLFAPREVFIQVFTDGVVGEVFPADCPETVRAQLAALGPDPTALGADAFAFRLTSRGAPVAGIWVGGVAFPARRDDYLRLAASLAEPCASTLLVAQAAERQRALERELTLALAQTRVANEQLLKANADLAQLHEQSRLRARAQLRGTEARLAAHVNHAPMAAIEFDREGRVTLWAGSAEALFGRTAEEVLGRTPAELPWLDEDDGPSLRAQREALLTGRATTALYTSRAHRPDGTERTCEWHCSALLDEAGQVASLLARVVDVTGRVEAQAELQRLYEAARVEAEVQAKLVTEVNHRVKNNLVSLLGLLLIEKRLGGPDALPPAAFERFSGRVRALLAAHELLTASRWNPVPAKDLVTRSLRSALESAGLANRTQLEVHAAPGLVVAAARAATLALILSELATNAGKYAVGDGRRLRLWVDVETVGPRLRFTVRDDGPGFPEDVLRGGRRGVGLRLAQELAVSALSGTLELTNDPGACVILSIEGEKTVTP